MSVTDVQEIDLQMQVDDELQSELDYQALALQVFANQVQQEKDRLELLVTFEMLVQNYRKTGTLPPVEDWHEFIIEAARLQALQERFKQRNSAFCLGLEGKNKKQAVTAPGVSLNRLINGNKAARLKSAVAETNKTTTNATTQGK